MAQAVDLPGHGALRLGRREGRDALSWALEAISEAGRWPRDVIGYSMGGRLALHFALRYPDRVTRLVLESASPGIEAAGDRKSRRKEDARLAGRMISDGLQAFSDEWERRPMFADDADLAPEGAAHAREVRLEQDVNSLAWALRELGTGALPSLWSELEKLTMPVLVIAGALDTKFVEIGRGMAALIPDARIAVVAGAGHRVHMVQPEAWLEAVGGFLSATGRLAAQ